MALEMVQDMTETIRSAQELIDVKYLNVVSFTILLCDYLCTLDLEITLIWKAKWTTVKTLFLLARYTAFIDLPLVFAYTFTPRPSLKYCSDVNAASLWLTAFGIACTEAILVVRTYALSGCNRKLLIYLIAQFTILCTGVVVVLAITVRTLTYSEQPLPTLPGCYLSWANPILFFVFILLVLHEIIIMVITLVIGYRKYRNHRTTLVQTLFGDGIIFFILLFFVSVANIINLAAGKPEHLDLFTTFQRVMHAVLSTRILLHVRQAVVETSDAPQEGIALSNVQFATNTSASEATTMPHGEDITVDREHRGRATKEKKIETGVGLGP